MYPGKPAGFAGQWKTIVISAVGTMLDAIEVKKNNRLADLMQLHGRRAGKINGGGAMVANKKKTGTCEMCGRHDIKVGKSHNLMVCSACMNVQCSINQRPMIVVDELLRLHGDKYFPASENAVETGAAMVLAEIRTALGADAQTVDVVDLPKMVNDAVFKVRELGKQSDQFAENAAALGDQVEQLTDSNNHLAAQLQEVEAERDAIEKESSGWLETIDKLRATVIDLGDEIKQLQDDNLNLMSADPDQAESKKMYELIAEVKAAAGLDAADPDADVVGVVKGLVDSVDWTDEIPVTETGVSISESTPPVGPLPGCVLDVSALLADRQLLCAVNVLAGAVR